MADRSLFDAIAGQAVSSGGQPVQQGAATGSPAFGAIAGQVVPPAGPAPVERGYLEQAGRVPVMAAQGFNEGLAHAVGALPDFVGARIGDAARLVGRPDLAPDPNFYTDLARSGLRTITGEPAPPENAVERAVQAGGRGVGEAATLAIPGAAVARLAPAGTLAAGVGQTLISQPLMQAAGGAVGGAVGEATGSPLLGFAASLATPFAARGVSPFPSRLNPEEARLAGVAAQEGIPLSPAQQTGSPSLRLMESSMSRLPGSAGGQQAAQEAQRISWQRAVLQRAGIDADYATPEVLEQARQRLGREFTDLTSRNNLQMTPAFARDLQRVARDAATLPEPVRPALQRHVRNVLNAVENGRISGERYRQIDSQLGRQIRSTTDGDLRNALRELQATLRQAMDASISPEDAQAWQEVRRQYAAFAAIRGAMDSGVAEAARGLIPPAQLNLSGRGAAGSTALGRGDLRDLRAIGQSVIRDQIPNSGTAERNIAANMLANPSLSGIGIGVIAPWLAQRAYSQPLVQGFLTNQVAGSIRPQANTLRAIAAAQAPAAVGAGTNALRDFLLQP